MKYKIVNPKRTIVTASIILIIIAMIVVIAMLCLKQKEKTVAKLESMEERKIEEPDGEYINTEEIEEQEEEKQEEQNIIEKNVSINEVKNEATNERTNNGKNTTSKIPYYIKVNYGAQVVTIYKQDEKGNYTIPLKAMICSTGIATPTSGVYSIPEKWEWLPLQGDVFGHYCTQIKGNILFHSVPYLRKKDPASLEYWEYDKLGTYASAGCIRLMVKDAKWIYDNCARGTKVEFYSSSNPGPLGKPSAKKIYSYPAYLKNWDPTDPDPNNPWLTYKETTPTTPKNEIATNVVQNTTANEVTNSTKNETENIINDKIETDKKNEIDNTIVKEKQNEIKEEIDKNKQNTIEQDNKLEKTNRVINGL